jgi:hypothetical protein
MLFTLNANLDTLSRFDVTLRRFFDLREQSIDHLRKAKTIISETELKDYGWEKKELEKAKEANEEVVKAIDAFLESAPQSDKELLRTGRLLERDSVPREAQNTWLFSEFKQYLSNVKKAEKTILAQKGYTINDNMQDILSAFKADKEKIIAEQENAASEDFFAELKEEARMKKSAMAVSGATPQERAKDFAKLNYLLTYRATDVDSNSCQLPVGENTNVINIKDRRRSRLKLKAKALKLKLQFQNAA